MRAVGEDEDGTATGILAKAAEDFGMESVEGFAHVAGFEGEEDPEAARECQHGRRRAARSSKASGKAAREAISRAAPQGSTMRNASAEAEWLTSTSANAGPERSRAGTSSRRLRNQAMKVWYWTPCWRAKAMALVPLRSKASSSDCFWAGESRRRPSLPARMIVESPASGWDDVDCIHGYVCSECTDSARGREQTAYILAEVEA